MNLQTDDQKRTLLLKIREIQNIPEFVSKCAKDNDLIVKNEFHITLIGFKSGEKLTDASFTEICEIAESISWNFSLTDEYYLLSKMYGDEKRTSIIQMISMNGIHELYKHMKGFDIPVPHITLYTTSTNEENKSVGIGIYSKNDFETLHSIKLQ